MSQHSFSNKEIHFICVEGCMEESASHGECSGCGFAFCGKCLGLPSSNICEKCLDNELELEKPMSCRDGEIVTIIS